MESDTQSALWSPSSDTETATRFDLQDRIDGLRCIPATYFIPVPATALATVIVGPRATCGFSGTDACTVMVNA